MSSGKLLTCGSSSVMISDLPVVSTLWCVWLQYYKKVIWLWQSCNLIGMLKFLFLGPSFLPIFIRPFSSGMQEVGSGNETSLYMTCSAAVQWGVQLQSDRYMSQCSFINIPSRPLTCSSDNHNTDKPHQLVHTTLCLQPQMQQVLGAHDIHDILHVIVARP